MPTRQNSSYKLFLISSLLAFPHTTVYASLVVSLEELIRAKTSLKNVEEHLKVTHFERQQLERQQQRDKLHNKELELQQKNKDRSCSLALLKEFSVKITLEDILLQRENLKKAQDLRAAPKVAQADKAINTVPHKFSTQTHVQKIYAAAGFAHFAANKEVEGPLWKKLNNKSFYDLISHYYSEGRGKDLTPLTPLESLEAHELIEKGVLIDHFNSGRTKFMTVMTELRNLVVPARTTITKIRRKVTPLIPGAMPLNIIDFLKACKYINCQDQAHALWVFKVLAPLGQSLLSDQRKPLRSFKSPVSKGKTNPPSVDKSFRILDKMHPRPHFLAKVPSQKVATLKENHEYMQEEQAYSEVSDSLYNHFVGFQQVLGAVSQPVSLRSVKVNEGNPHSYQEDKDFRVADILDKMLPRKHYAERSATHVSSVKPNPHYRTRKLNIYNRGASLKKHIMVFQNTLETIRAYQLTSLKPLSYVFQDDDTVNLAKKAPLQYFMDSFKRQNFETPLPRNRNEQQFQECQDFLPLLMRYSRAHAQVLGEARNHTFFKRHTNEEVVLDPKLEEVLDLRLAQSFVFTLNQPSKAVAAASSSEPIVISPRRDNIASAPLQPVASTKGRGWWPWGSTKAASQQKLPFIKVEWKPINAEEDLKKNKGQNLRAKVSQMAEHKEWQETHKRRLHEDNSYLLWSARLGIPAGLIEAEIEVISFADYEEERLKYLKMLEEQKKGSTVSTPVGTSYFPFKLW